MILLKFLVFLSPVFPVLLPATAGANKIHQPPDREANKVIQPVQWWPDVGLLTLVKTNGRSEDCEVLGREPGVFDLYIQFQFNVSILIIGFHFISYLRI